MKRRMKNITFDRDDNWCDEALKSYCETNKKEPSKLCII